MSEPFRLPERLGPFSLWIAPDVYPAAASARAALEGHSRLVRDRLRLTLPGSVASDLGQDPEFLESAQKVLFELEALWFEIERHQTLEVFGAMPQVRRLFLASVVEWALELNYEVRTMRRESDGSRERWLVMGRAWDGDRTFDYTVRSASYEAGNPGASELALLQGLGFAYTGAIGGIMGIPGLDPAAEPPPALREP